MQVASKAGVALLSLAGHSIIYEQFHGFSFDEPWIVEGTGLETFGHYYPWPKGKKLLAEYHRRSAHRTIFAHWVYYHFMVRSFLKKSDRSNIARPLLNPSLIHPQL